MNLLPIIVTTVPHIPHSSDEDACSKCCNAASGIEPENEAWFAVIAIIVLFILGFLAVYGIYYGMKCLAGKK